VKCGTSAVSGKPILPVRVRHTEIPAALRDYQLLDLAGLPPDTDVAREVRHAYEAWRTRPAPAARGANTGDMARMRRSRATDDAESLENVAGDDVLVGDTAG